MPKSKGVRSSQHTAKKESDFHSIAGAWLAIVKRILTKHSGKSWLYQVAQYIDMNAGTGWQEGDGGGLGSALIVPDLAQTLHVPLQCYLCEMHPPTLDRLFENVAMARGSFEILEGDHRERIPELAARWALERALRYTLLYFDGNADSEIPTATIRCLTELDCLRKMDVLLHVSGNSIKRARGKGLERSRLDQIVAEIGKQHVHIQRPDAKWQWTFLLFSDSPILNDKFRKLDFRNVKETQGREWLERLSYTKPELEAQRQPTLPDFSAIPHLPRVSPASGILGGESAGDETGGRHLRAVQKEEGDRAAPPTLPGMGDF